MTLVGIGYIITCPRRTRRESDRPVGTHAHGDEGDCGGFRKVRQGVLGAPGGSHREGDALATKVCGTQCAHTETRAAHENAGVHAGRLMAIARRARRAAAAARPDPARDAAGIHPARRAARLFLCCVLCAVCTRPHTRSDFIRSQAKSREMDFPFTQGQSRRPNLSGGSVAPDPGRPRVVAPPGSTRTAGRPWADPRSVVRSANKRGRPAVDRTHGSTPGRFSESCCCAWRV